MSKSSVLISFIVAFLVTFIVATNAFALSSPSPSPTGYPSPEPTSRPTLTDKSEETIGPLEKLINNQTIGSPWTNPVKHAIRGAITSGVPANTIVLLLLLPLVAAVIAGARHLIGLRGFGIFLPASLSVVFVAIGPILGVGLFVVITLISLIVRLVLKRVHLRLQYLPRMALLLWAVSFGVLGVLFAAPYLKNFGISNVSIFPVLILTLLTEDFTRAQLGKSVKTAISLTSETLILALACFLVLTFKPIQEFALLNPEMTLVGVAIFDFLIGRYAGLRFLEFWRFRKLISS